MRARGSGVAPLTDAKPGALQIPLSGCCGVSAVVSTGESSVCQGNAREGSPLCCAASVPSGRLILLLLLLPEEPTDRHDNTAPADTMGAPVVGGVDPAAGRKRGRPPDEPDERAAERPKRNIATRVEGAYNQLLGKRAPPRRGRRARDERWGSTLCEAASLHVMG